MLPVSKTQLEGNPEPRNLYSWPDDENDEDDNGEGPGLEPGKRAPANNPTGEQRQGVFEDTAPTLDDVHDIQPPQSRIDKPDASGKSHPERIEVEMYIVTALHEVRDGRLVVRKVRRRAHDEQYLQAHGVSKAVALPHLGLADL